jgi:hypothetical protein
MKDKSKWTKFLSAALLVVFVSMGMNAFATANVTINWSNEDDGRFFSDFGGTTPLSAGNLGTAGDGFFLQFVAIQSGTNFILGTGTIGDNPATVFGAQGNGIDGYFQIALVVNSATADQVLGAPLAVVFYNATTIGSATHFGIVSNLSIVMPPHAVPTTTNFLIKVDHAGFLGPRTSGNNGFYTDTLIPEPSTFLLVGLGLGGLMMLRRRKR